MGMPVLCINNGRDWARGLALWVLVVFRSIRLGKYIGERTSNVVVMGLGTDG